MTTTPLTSLAGAEASGPLISRRGWGWIVILGGLFAAYHGMFLKRSFIFATTDNNWSHILIVPLIGLYYIFQHQERLRRAPKRVCWWGLPILLVGLIGHAFWIFPGRNDMFQGYFMILGLFGLVLFLLGPRAMGVLWFPIAYLVFGVKVSDRIWEQVAFHLQQIAAKGATFCLQCFGAVMGFDASVTGSQIHLSFLPDPLNVAEACSGLRMLMAFVALAAAMAFLWDRTWWQRATMVLMAVPIAVGVNIGRVTVLGLLCLVNPALAHGSFHIFVGMLMLIPAAGLFLLLGWVLDHILIPEEQGAAAAKSDAAHRPQTPPAQPSDQAAPLQPRLIGRSVAVGAGLTLLVGLAYALALFSIRPDLLMEAIPRWLPPVLLVVTVAALAALTVGLPRLASIRKRTGPAGLALASGLAGGVLLTAMLGQNAVIAATQAVLIKKPLPLRHELAMVPRRLGAWEQQGEDRQMSAEIVEALGSKQYIDRIYQDTSWTPTNAPGGYARLHVVYYTGTPDTVPHVPERCFVAGGLTHLGQHYPTLELAGQDYMPDAEQNGYWHPSLLEGRSRVPQLSIPVTAFTFGYPDQPDRIENVFYFFIANGKFLPTPDHVRLHGFDPRDAYSYYCKVEVQIFQVADEELAARRAADLLSAAMPEILACLPDWVDVQAGRWPLSAETAADAGR